MAERWLTVLQAAAQLGVSPSTVRRRIEEGKLEVRDGKGGKRVRVKPDGEASGGANAGAATRHEVEATEPARGDGDASAVRPTDTVAASASTGSNLSNGASADGQAAASGTAAAAASERPGEADRGANGSAREAFGGARYSPLPHGQVGTRPSGRPHAKLTPGELLGEGKRDETAEPEDELTRYQRLAGASVMLAQRQADEAAEQVAHARYQVRQLRRLCVASWAGAGALTLIATVLMISFAFGAHRASADLAAQEKITRAAQAEAQQADDELDVVQRELAAAQARADEFRAQLDSTRDRARGLERQVAELEAAKRQADQALQAALASLHEARGGEVRSSSKAPGSPYGHTPLSSAPTDD